MVLQNSKIIGEGLTYDDVLLVPNYSNILPREVNIQSKFSRNITLNVPIASAAMDTVTESALAIALAKMGGIGFIHRNLSIENQAKEVFLKCKILNIFSQIGLSNSQPVLV
jgi:IMP dehydrogenase